MSFVPIYVLKSLLQILLKVRISAKVNLRCSPVCLDVLRLFSFFFFFSHWACVMLSQHFQVQFHCLCKSSSTASGKLLVGTLYVCFLLGTFYDLFWFTIRRRHCCFTRINNITILTSSEKWQVLASQTNRRPVLHSDS